MGDSPHPDVIHLVPNPLAAARFVEPLALALRREGIGAEIWSERGVYESLTGRLDCPLQWHAFSLGANPLKMAVGFLRLWAGFKKSRPAAVEAHFSRGALIPLLAARLAGVEVRIYHNHGIPYLGYGGMLRLALKWLERINIRLASHVITVAPGMCRAYVRDGLLSASECTVIGPGSACGLDLSEYAFPADPGGKAGGKERLGLGSRFVVLYVGRPHRRKGFHLVLSAWERHFRDSPDMRLLLAGIEPRDVEDALGKSFPENVQALGFVEDLRPYYAAADVVVLPSEHEGFGYALLEGAASGCCLIASDIPGPDAILMHGVNGYAIPPGDSRALADRIAELRDNPQLRFDMSVAARESAGQFDRDPILSKYSEFMHAALGRTPGEGR